MHPVQPLIKYFSIFCAGDRALNEIQKLLPVIKLFTCYFVLFCTRYASIKFIPHTKSLISWSLPSRVGHKQVKYLECQMVVDITGEKMKLGRWNMPRRGTAIAILIGWSRKGLLVKKI